MKKYFLYVKKGLLWSLSFIIILSLIHYLRVQKFYGYDWYLLAIPIVLLIGGPLYALNPDWTCNDEFGTAPDIYNLPGKDALETCLEEIRKLGERTNF